MYICSVTKLWSVQSGTVHMSFFVQPVFLYVYGAQESIPRNDSASLCNLAGRYNNPIPPRFIAIDCLKIPAQHCMEANSIRGEDMDMTQS
jgi:hypothetical protein